MSRDRAIARRLVPADADDEAVAEATLLVASVRGYFRPPYPASLTDPDLDRFFRERLHRRVFRDADDADAIERLRERIYAVLDLLEAERTGGQ